MKSSGTFRGHSPGIACVREREEVGEGEDRGREVAAGQEGPKKMTRELIS